MNLMLKRCSKNQIYNTLTNRISTIIVASMSQFFRGALAGCCIVFFAIPAIFAQQQGAEMTMSWKWPEQAILFDVQQNSKLGSAQWTNLEGVAIAENDGSYEITVVAAPEGKSSFYRLAKRVMQREEVDLTSLEQLQDPASVGKILLVNRNLNLNGASIEIRNGVILRPAGGTLFNGAIRGGDFDILTIGKNRIFGDDLIFETRYTKSFLPEWYGARADGVLDDGLAFEKSIAALGGKVEIVIQLETNRYGTDPIGVYGPLNMKKRRRG